MFMPEEIINTYSGIRTPEGIFVNVDCTPLDKARDVINHSVDFNWGYNGSGPAQLALAIMVHEYGKDLSTHPIHYQEFKSKIIAQFDENYFELNSFTIRELVENNS